MNEKNRPIRVALIGYGFSGRTFHAPLIRSVPGLSLDFVASSDEAKVHADLPGVEVTDNALGLATDPRADLVVIATPNDSHAALARAALDAGSNVVVDKPFTLSLKEARELAALAESRRLLLSVFQNRRWDTDFLSIRHVIDRGLIGEAVHLESRIDRFRPEVLPRWREQVGPGSGLLWDLGPHLIDQTLLLFGWPDTVQAGIALQREGAQCEDWAHIVLGFGARRAILHVGMLAAGGSPRFLVHGTRGSALKMRPDPQEAHLRAGLRPGEDGWGIDEDELMLFDAAQAEHRMPASRGDQSLYYAGIRDALRGQGRNPVTPREAVEVIAVLEAAMLSAREGRVVAPEPCDT